MEAKLVLAAMSLEVEILAAPDGKTKASPVVGTAFSAQLAAKFHKLLELPSHVRVAAFTLKIFRDKTTRMKILLITITKNVFANLITKSILHNHLTGNGYSLHKQKQQALIKKTTFLKHILGDLNAFNLPPLNTTYKLKRY